MMIEKLVILAVLVGGAVNVLALSADFGSAQGLVQYLAGVCSGVTLGIIGTAWPRLWRSFRGDSR